MSRTVTGIFPYKNTPAQKKASVNIPDNLHDSTGMNKKKLGKDRKVREAKKKRGCQRCNSYSICFPFVKKMCKKFSVYKITYARM